MSSLWDQLLPCSRREHFCSCDLDNVPCVLIVWRKVCKGKRKRLWNFHPPPFFGPALRTRETWTEKTVWESGRGVGRTSVRAGDRCEAAAGRAGTAAGPSSGSRPRKNTSRPGAVRTEPKVIGSTQQGESQEFNCKIFKVGTNFLYW